MAQNDAFPHRILTAVPVVQRVKAELFSAKKQQRGLIELHYCELQNSCPFVCI